MDSPTLFERLKSLFPDSSHTSLRKWLANGRITVNGRVARRGEKSVSLEDDVRLVSKEKKLGKGVRLIYEDSDVVVVDKPSGLLSVADDRGSLSLHGLLKAYYKGQKVYVIHRIDRGTSGLLLFALSEKAFLGLKELFATHTIERKYVGICEGVFAQKEGSFEDLLFEDKNQFVRITKDRTKGRRACTHYRVLKEKRESTLVEFSLETGRKHQIRVQVAQRGHPITGDQRYQAKNDPLKRLALHAKWLCFEHPCTGKVMRFSSEVPRSFL